MRGSLRSGGVKFGPPQMTKDDLNLENPQLIVGHKKQIINPKPIVKDTKKSVIEVSNP